MYNIICMEMIHMHHVLCYFVHKIWFEEFVYAMRAAAEMSGRVLR